MQNRIPEAVLVRLPSSHRGRDKASAVLGYTPHSWHSFRKNGSFTFLPAPDASKLLEAHRATRTRIDPETLFGCWYQPDPYRGTPPKDETCPHISIRIVHIPNEPHNRCCECGKVQNQP